jgi:hypothetical protein
MKQRVGLEIPPTYNGSSSWRWARKSGAGPGHDHDYDMTRVGDARRE